MAGRFSIESVFKAVDRITGPVKRMSKTVNKFIRQTRLRVAGLTKAFKKLGGFIGKSVAVGAAIATAAMGAAILKTAEFGDEAAKTSRRLGITAEALQELRFAADRQGVSGGLLTKSFTALQKRVGELKSGTGSLFSFLKKTGNKTFIDQIAQAKNTEEAFNLLVGEINKIKDPMKRAAFASAAFSRGGVDMLKFIEAGPEGIKKLRLEAQKYGAVISDDAAAKSEIFIDALTNLKASLTGIGRTFATKVNPFIADIMQNFADFWALNKKIIAQGMDRFINFMGRAFKRLNPPVTELFKALNELLSAFFEAVGSLLPDFKMGVSDLFSVITFLLNALTFLADIGMKAFKFISFFSPFLKPFLAVLAGYLGVLITIAALTKGWAIAQGILNAVLMTNPITLIVIAIAALVAGIIVLIKNWDLVVEVFKTGAEKIWNFLMRLLDNPFIVSIGTIFAPFLTIPLLIIKHWEPIKTFFIDLWADITNAFESAMSTVTNIINTVDRFLEDKIGGVLNTIGNIAAKFGIDLGLREQQESPESARVVTGGDRISRSFIENRQTTSADILIRDESGRADLNQRAPVPGVRIAMAESGGM